mmetsp:Transcript_661/g.895  ORF Transcript_661/g.895 Transcript_661/m.895 type:complete len:233 (+) Transcript_661:369-1067(+)
MTPDPIVIRKLMNPSDSRKSMILIIDNLGSRSLNIIHRNRINPTKYLSGSHPPSIRQELPSNILGDIRVPIQSHEHGSLEIDLGPLHLLVRWIMRHTHKISHDVPHEIIKFVIRCSSINTKETGILVTGVEGRDRMGELMLGHLLTHFGRDVLPESTRAIVGSEHVLHEHEGKGIFGGPTGTLKRESNVCRIIRIEFDTNVGSGEDRGIHRHLYAIFGCGGEGSKVFGGHGA